MKTAITFNPDEIVELTVMESLVVTALNKADDYDNRPHLHIDDLCNATGITMNQLRGVLSSLVQKDVAVIEKDFFRKGDTIVFLFHYQQ